jgi:high-affinity nickel permease
MMRLQTILYIIQVVSLTTALICTLVMTFRVNNAISYMNNYIREHQNKRGIVSREFKKVIKMLKGK